MNKLSKLHSKYEKKKIVCEKKVIPYAEQWRNIGFGGLWTKNFLMGHFG